jgi:hypothetical protein
MRSSAFPFAIVLFHSLLMGSCTGVQERSHKTTSAAGEVVLIDSNKSYLILVTKEGKLLTFDFSPKTKVTDSTGMPKYNIESINPGEAAKLMYRTEGSKNLVTEIELLGYRPGGCPEGRPCPSGDDKDKKVKGSRPETKKPESK